MIGSINTDRFSELNFLRNIEVGSRNGTGFQAEQTNQGNRQATVGNQPDQVNGANVNANREDSQNKISGENDPNKTDRGAQGGTKTDEQLSEEDKREVQELKETDRKVRAHEMAHLSAAAGIAMSGANFEYKRGPDGVNYAVGGDVQIDVSKERTPEATIEKARRISAAAMAPADPSPQDRQVASRARAMEAEARAEMAKGTQEGTLNKSGDTEEFGRISPTESSQEKNGTAQTSPATGTTDTNRTHPGIDTYKQNQAFAPRTPSSFADKSTFAATAVQQTIPGFRFNLVA
jgi:hypothetical protein